MSLTINTATLDPRTLDDNQLLWVYNGLDTMVTREVLDELIPQLDAVTARTYAFTRALQAPVLAMMTKGILIDRAARSELIAKFQARKDLLAARLDRLALAACDTTLNANSPKQLQHFFYDLMHLPPVIVRQKGESKVSTNREAMETLRAYFHAMPLCNHVLAFRDAAKMLGVLRTGVEDDGRMRCSFAVAGTETGRMSSSRSAFNFGTNLQNITELLRRMFVADPGHGLAYIDLEQAEARLVAIIIWYFFNDTKYLDACESGDLHTTVAKMVWPHLPWTGVLKEDKAVAELPFYRIFSYRDTSKRLGHASNYYGTAFTLANILKIPQSVVKEFQDLYLNQAFPGIRRMHYKVAELLQTTGQITTLTGRRRTFFDRLSDDSTLRKAIAYGPQGAIADIMNQGILQLFRTHQQTPTSLPDLPRPPPIALLAQVHDAILFQYPLILHPHIPTLAKALSVPLTLTNQAGVTRTFLIPYDIKVGYNWAKQYTDEDRARDIKSNRKPAALNPDGLAKWSPFLRTRRDRPDIPMLDRIIHRGL